MIQFASPEYLLLILVIPLFFIFYALHKRERNRKIARLGGLKVVGKLMPERSKYKGWVRIVLFSLAWFFIMIGMARPQIGARIKESQKEGSEIMIALDVSNSMLAEDYSPNRLERAKLAISRLVDKMHGDRIGLIVFAGNSFVQLPITTDYVSAKIFLNSISTESIPIQGTALGEAITTAIRGFSTDAQMGTNNKAIILITDGENHEDDAIEAAKTAAEVGIKVYTIGVGSQEGKPIPMNGELLKDKDGNIVVTKLNEQILDEIATAGNGAYVRAGNTEFGLNPIIDDLKNLESEQYQSVVFEDFDEQYMYFLAIGLFFLLLEFLVGSRRVGRKMFSIAILLCFTAFNASAQVDKGEVRKGNRFFKDGNYQEAEIEYRKALLKDTLSFAANYNLANVLMKSEAADQAEKIYANIADTVKKVPFYLDWNPDTTKVSPTAASNYYHNLGNSYLSQDKYSEAVEAYKNSLRINPNDMETKANYAYAKKKADDKEEQDQNQQNQGGGGGDNQQNQDQQDNKDQDKKDDQDKNQDQQGGDDKNKDKPENKQGNAPQQITPQAAEQMLKAMQEKENQTQEKVKKEKAKVLKSKQKEKNW